MSKQEQQRCALQRYLTLTSAVAAYKKYRTRELNAVRAVSKRLVEDKVALQALFLARPTLEYTTADGRVSATVQKPKAAASKKIEIAQGAQVLSNILRSHKDKVLTSQEIDRLVKKAEKTLEGENAGAGAGAGGAVPAAAAAAGAAGAAAEQVVKITCKPTPLGLKPFDFDRMDPERLMTFLARREWTTADNNCVHLLRQFATKAGAAPAKKKAVVVRGGEEEEEEKDGEGESEDIEASEEDEEEEDEEGEDDKDFIDNDEDEAEEEDEADEEDEEEDEEEDATESKEDAEDAEEGEEPGNNSTTTITKAPPSRKR